jgi:hypothetical protein
MRNLPGRSVQTAILSYSSSVLLSALRRKPSPVGCSARPWIPRGETAKEPTSSECWPSTEDHIRT